MADEKINNLIKETAYQVAQAIKAENSGFAPELRQQLKVVIQTQAEIQQQLTKQDEAQKIQNELHQRQAIEIEYLKANVEEVKETIESWKWGGKVTIGTFAVIGAFVAWILSAFGLHLGIK